ncbi:MAG: FAD-binding protein, partial [Oscillospiraceae bacterium]|nr:FAD-binding protein [Oscillospiraceae bacterium]
HNGGIAVDRWWQTSLTGLFAVGECAGTHGVTRPGGSALNAGQVGSLRAAQYISAQKKPLLTQEGFLSALNVAEQRHLNIIKQIKTNDSNVTDRLQAAQRRMSDCAAAIRDPIRMTTALKQVTKELSSLSETVGVRDARSVFLYYKLADVLITQQAVLTAMIDYAETVGKTRGSALYFDSRGAVREGLEEIFRFTQEDGATRSKVQETVLTDGEFVSSWRSVRPIPTDDDFFENVWRGYRENKNID